MIFVFGTADIMHLMHAFAAVRESVNTTLRCATSTDGCYKTANQEGSTPNARYRYYLDTTPSKRFVNEKNYSGKASWFSMLGYSFDEISATVLDEVAYKYENFTLRLPEYQAIAKYGYFVREKDFPKFTHPTENNDNKSDPLPNRDIIISGGNIVLEKSYTRNNLLDGKKSGSKISFEYTINKPNKLNVPIELNEFNNTSNCFVQRSNGEIDFNSSCTYDWSAEKASYKNPAQGANLVILVKGFSSSRYLNKNNCSATVKLKINGKDIGGRLLEDSNYTNFIPRGAPQSSRYYSNDFLYSTEVINHQNISFDYDKPFKLEFSWDKIKNSGNNCDLNWSLTKIIMYAPEYRFKGAVSSCMLTKSTLPNSSMFCLPHLPNQVKKIDINPTPLFNEKISIGCAKDLHDAQNKAFSFGKNSDWEVVSSGITSNVKKCPKIAEHEEGYQYNYGIVHDIDSLEGQMEARRICPLPQNIINTCGYENIDANWSEKDVLIQEEFTWLPTNCHELHNAEYLNELNKYPKKHGEIRKIFHDVFVSEDPEYLKTTDSYLCNEIEVKKIGYNDEGLFTSSQDLGCNWVDKLKESAITLGMPEQAFFAASAVNTGRMIELKDSTAIDSCMEYKEQKSDQHDEILLPGEYINGDMPNECQNSPIRCRKEFIGWENQTPPSSIDSLDKDAAIAEGQGLLKATFPKARINCDVNKNYCSNITVDNNEGLITVRSTMNVPLKVLLNKTIKIKSAGSKFEEKHYLK